MKTNSLKTILAGAALLMGTAASAQVGLADNVKHYFAVSGYNGSKEVTVSSTVYDGYGFMVQLANPENAVVGANKFKVDVALQDVNSLNAKSELRVHSRTFETSVSGFSGDLTEWMKFAYNMPAVKVPVTVIDGAKTASFEYQIAATNENYQIVGTPVTEDAARKSWNIITNNVLSFKKTSDDSFFGFKAGSYIQFGDECLSFTKDANPLTEPWTVDGLKNEINSSIKLVDAGVSGADTYKAVIYMPAGTSLSVSNSKAILQKNATITFDLTSLYQGKELTEQFSSIMANIEKYPGNKSQAAIFEFFNTFNNILYFIGQAGTVPVTVEFTPAPANLTVYAGDATPIKNATAAQFAEISSACPNAMAVLNYGECPEMPNVLCIQKDGSYVCPNFVLTDLSQNPTPAFAASTAWYSPVDFVAVSGSYSRINLNNGYASACLPFAVTSDMLAGSEILTYSNYDGQYLASFTTGDCNEAGVPFIAEANGADWNVVFNNTDVKAAVVNGNSTYGTYVATDEYAEEYFGVKASINKFARLASTLYPFRSCLELHPTVEAAAKGITIMKIGATGIKNVANSASQTIYNVNGVKVNEISKLGLYIVNGKKCYVK